MNAHGYYGELLHRRTAGPFVLTESIFRGGTHLPVHAHESPYFTFTLKGSYRERYGSRSRLCMAGTGVAHPAQENHSQVFDREPTLLMRVAIADGADTDARVDRPATSRGPLLAHTLNQLHCELQCSDSFSEIIIESLAYELVGSMLSGAWGGGSRSRAMHAQMLLRSSLRWPLSIDVIAAEIGVSRATLFRDFKSTFGCSPGEYLRMTRIDVAIDALTAGVAPVTQIAAVAGFYDQSHFDRCFKKALGVSPSKYRQSVRRSS
jgi:AraC family transcriptional regulator